ncbi:hypothetical protein OG607_44970 [Streptomyces sp. NBC_01537]|uniref:hypothetical protein n=1 Tax=Streptomyces sp. NBC_01537 TaxID=2903896 RepID=UPI0038704C94
MTDPDSPTARNQPADLSEDEPPAPSAGLGGIVRLQPPPHREHTRRFLAIGLLLLVALQVLLAETAFVFDKDFTPEKFRELSLLFTPVVTLASAAFGFFFGSASANAATGSRPE